MRRTVTPAAFLGLTVTLLATGCAPKKTTVAFVYDLPPDVVIPANVRSVGIAEFQTGPLTGERWGRSVSDLVASAMRTRSGLFDREAVLDRSQLAAVTGSQASPAAADGPSAARQGMAAGVDAVVYGRATLTGSGETDASALRQRFTAVADITMVEVRTQRTIVTASLRDGYDVRAEPPPDSATGSVTIDTVGEEIFRRIARRFVARMTPRQVVVREELETSDAPGVREGNHLAARGNYDEALAAYRAVIAQDPTDGGASFNAGVVCEAMTRFDRAQRYYNEAVRLSPDPRRLSARQRAGDALRLIRGH